MSLPGLERGTFTLIFLHFNFFQCATKTQKCHTQESNGGPSHLETSPLSTRLTCFQKRKKIAPKSHFPGRILKGVKFNPLTICGVSHLFWCKISQNVVANRHIFWTISVRRRRRSRRRRRRRKVIHKHSVCTISQKRRILPANELKICIFCETTVIPFLAPSTPRFFQFVVQN